MTESDLLPIAQAKLSDSNLSARARTHVLWSFAKSARDLGTTEIVIEEFTKLARETRLTFHPDFHGRGAEDIAHILSWALRGMNPFEKGPLK